MVLELHVWGPAFGLPSIDPACIATVAYFNRIVPHGQWTLVADHDPLSSPQGEFPLLIDADRKITGFGSIVSYLRNHHSGAYDLDYNISHREQTERTAFVSFLESTANPLIDLYLYVSSENYNATTSTAYTAILPWHTNYVVPPRRRDVARSRTTHLGLSNLDVTEASQESSGPGKGTAISEYEAAKRAAGVPAHEGPTALNMGRGKGLGGLLGSPVLAARFKLDALSSELLQPLSDQLGKKDYLLEGDKPSSLDCLVFGYLALLLFPPVPQAWVKEVILTKFPKIHRYIRRLREDLLGNEDVKAIEVWSVTTGQATADALSMQLPWVRLQSRATPSQIIGSAHDLVMPQGLRRGPSTQHGAKGHSTSASSALPNSAVMSTLTAATSVAAIGLAALAAHHRRSPRDRPLIFWGLRPPQGGLDGFGVESFLGMLPR